MVGVSLSYVRGLCLEELSNGYDSILLKRVSFDRAIEKTGLGYCKYKNHFLTMNY